MAWYVVRTNIKSEEKAERNLRRAGFIVYSPMARIERFNKRRKVWIETALRLMPRYLFVEVDGAVPWFTLRACEGVESVLGWQGMPARLNERDSKVLRDVQQAEADLQFDTTRAAKIRRGEIGKNKRDTVRMKFPAGASIKITDGPFAETKEVLLGYYKIRIDSEQAARQLAAQCPTAGYVDLRLVGLER